MWLPAEHYLYMTCCELCLRILAMHMTVCRQTNSWSVKS